MGSHRKKRLRTKVRRWLRHKWGEMLFYKDFDIVFGLRYSNKRHKAYLLRTQKVCQECGASEDLTLDHIVPLKLKGKDKLWNKQLLCKKCNSKKGHTPYSINRSRAMKLHFNRPDHKPLPLEMRVLVSSLWKLIRRKCRRRRRNRESKDSNTLPKGGTV